MLPVGHFNLVWKSKYGKSHFWSYLSQKLSYSVLVGPTYAVLSPWTFLILWFAYQKWLLHIKSLDFVKKLHFRKCPNRVNCVFNHILEKLSYSVFLCQGEQDSIFLPKKHTVGWCLPEIWPKMWFTLFGHFRKCSFLTKSKILKESLFGYKAYKMKCPGWPKSISMPKKHIVV